MKLLLVVVVVALTVALVNGYRGFGGGGGYGGGKGYGGKPFQTKGNDGGPGGYGQGKYPPRQTGRGCPIRMPNCVKQVFKQDKPDRPPIVGGTGPGTVSEGGMCYNFADCISGLMCKRSYAGAPYGTCQRLSGMPPQTQPQQQRPPSVYDNVPETQQGKWPAGYGPPQQAPEQGRRYIPGQGWVDGR